VEAFIKALPGVIEAAGASPVVLEAACLGAWKHAVGETLSARAQAEALRDQTLVVAVEDMVWQRQLEQMRDQFLFRLNNVLGRRVVKVIEFRIAPEKFAVQKPVADKTQTRSIPIELVSAAASIKDPGLRKAFLGAAVSCVNRLEEQDANQRG
jgi:predicted nucleic acid-binding Zn ribbon protein